VNTVVCAEPYVSAKHRRILTSSENSRKLKLPGYMTAVCEILIPVCNGGGNVLQMILRRSLQQLRLSQSINSAFGATKNGETQSFGKTVTSRETGKVGCVEVLESQVSNIQLPRAVTLGGGRLRRRRSFTSRSTGSGYVLQWLLGLQQRQRRLFVRKAEVAA